MVHRREARTGVVNEGDFGGSRDGFFLFKLGNIKQWLNADGSDPEKGHTAGFVGRARIVGVLSSGRQKCLSLMPKVASYGVKDT